MRRYLVGRLLQAVPSLVFLSALVFVLLRVMPGDVATVILGGGGEGGGAIKEEQVLALRQKLGLDRPLAVQYADWLGRAFTGDLGTSVFRDETVWDILARAGPVTLELAVLSSAVAVAVGVPLGVVAALHQDRWADHLARVISVAGLSMPTFLTGTLVVLGLALFANWFPSFSADPFWRDPLSNLSQFVWPSVVLGYFFAAYITRMTRSQMLEVLREDYIRTARAKGLAARVVTYRHAFRNALLPVVTLMAVLFAALISGAVIVERIFFLPGLGNALVEAVTQRDVFIIQGLVVIIGVSVLLVNLCIDLLYSVLDPRISVR